MVKKAELNVVSSPRSYTAVESQLSSLTCHRTFVYYEFVYFTVTRNIGLQQEQQICRLRGSAESLHEIIAVLSNAVPEQEVANLSSREGLQPEHGSPPACLNTTVLSCSLGVPIKVGAK